MAYIARITYASGHNDKNGKFCNCVIFFVTGKKQICPACGFFYKNKHKKYRHKNILIDDVSEDFLDGCV